VEAFYHLVHQLGLSINPLAIAMIAHVFVLRPMILSRFFERLRQRNKFAECDLDLHQVAPAYPHLTAMRRAAGRVHT
jgi:hypothetical protein